MIDAITGRVVRLEPDHLVIETGGVTAQRILIDLRDKVTADLMGTPGVLPLSEKEEMALRALTSKSLGFSGRDARRAIERLRGEDLPLEDLVRRALEIIGT